jgi:hypothetical protein
LRFAKGYPAKVDHLGAGTAPRVSRLRHLPLPHTIGNVNSRRATTNRSTRDSEWLTASRGEPLPIHLNRWYS